jgi:hypothetical protein
LSWFWLILLQQWTIKISSPLFYIFSLAAILAGSRDQRTQFWKRAIQIPFHQSLVAIGPVVSEKKIKVYDVRRTDGRTNERTDDGRRTTDDGRQVMAKSHLAAKNQGKLRCSDRIRSSCFTCETFVLLLYVDTVW